MPSLSPDDRPLVIVIHPTGHVESGSAKVGWVVIGYVQTDEHGGTRTPVVPSGTDLGLAPAPAEPVTLLGLSRALCAFLANDVERRDYLERLGWAEDPLPAYTEQQWQLLEAEHERMQHHADATFTTGANA